MREFQRQIDQWQREQKKIFLARVIQTWGSSPRPSGSVMFISSDLEMAGSVSGGCVEGAVVKEVKSALESNNGKRLAYGVTDDDAWAVGLTCGGQVQVFIQPWTGERIFDELEQGLSRNEGRVLITSLVDGTVKNALIDTKDKVSGADLPLAVIEKAKQAFATRAHGIVTENDIDYFIHVFPPCSKVIIIGAAHIAAELVPLAHDFDFETIVIDPRATFAKNTTFSMKPDQMLEKYPSEVLNDFELDPYTYAVILSHDPKIDDNALEILLKKDVAYIGALGSKKNHEKRTARLLAKGFTVEEVARIDAPVGVDIKAKGAKEIALSIMGAVIRAKNLYQS